MKDILLTHRTLIFGVAALALIGTVVFMSERPVPRFSPTEFLKAESFWKSEIHRIGAPAAYKEFVSSAQDEETVSAHVTAHAVGFALFEEEGDAGLSFCDPSFGFGCYHGFFLKALGTEGESRVSALYDVCLKTYGFLGTGCQHGIGHGIMEYVGYDDVPRALALCTALAPQPAPLLGCTDGVFMEYFWPLGGEGTQRVPTSRPIDAENPYAPCRSVGKEFEDVCYFEQGVRYFETSGTDYVALCSALSGDARTFCALGVGSTSLKGPSPLSASLGVCSSFASSGDELSCRAGVAWSLFSVGREGDMAAACAYDEPKKSAECFSLSDLTRGRDATFPKFKP